MRLFISIAHASLNGPVEGDVWYDVPNQLPVAVPTYLVLWKDSFELFHPTTPWLQITGLVNTWTPTSKLNITWANGANSTMFDHAGMDEDREITDSEKLLSLLSYLCFSACGLMSQATWNGVQTAKSALDSPCIPGSMLHSMLRGCNLLNTIHLNLPNYEDIEANYPGRPIGRPVWEAMPTSFSDSDAIYNATETYVGRLVPMSRFIQFSPDGNSVLLSEGLRYPNFDGGFPQEPTATSVVRKIKGEEKRIVLSYRPQNAIWRQLGAIVVKRKAGQFGGPLSLNAIYEGQACDLVVCGIAREPGKANYLDFTESVFHIPAPMMTANGAGCYDAEIQFAEQKANNLGYAVSRYCESLTEAPGRRRGQASEYFWTHIETNLNVLMAFIDTIGTSNEDKRQAWRKLVTATMYAAYKNTCSNDTPRQIKAFQVGLSELTKSSVTEGGTQP